MLKLVNFSGSFKVAIFLKYSALVVSVSCTLLAEGIEVCFKIQIFYSLSVTKLVGGIAWPYLIPCRLR